MRTLIVEDDFTCRRLPQRLLLPYGECDVAVNGKEAIEAFRLATEKDRPYDLICLDIMMLEMNGHETLKAIREIEEADGIYGLNGVKVPMTTALDDPKNILGAFRSQCEAYLVKPIEKQRLVKELGNHGLLGDSAG